MHDNHPIFIMLPPGLETGNLSPTSMACLCMSPDLPDTAMPDATDYMRQHASGFPMLQTFDNNQNNTTRSTPMTKPERAEMYKSYLAEEGYIPKIDGDGDVLFKYEGKTYAIIIDPDDDIFFNLAIPGFWSIESEEERAQVAQAALFATSRTKVAKVYPTKDNTVASVQMFCSPPEAFQAVFERALCALQDSVQTFRKKMMNEDKPLENEG